MASDLMQILLSAQIDPKAIVNIRSQLNKISGEAIKLNVQVDKKAFADIENINKKLSGIKTPIINTESSTKGMEKLTESTKSAKTNLTGFTNTAKESGTMMSRLTENIFKFSRFYLVGGFIVAGVNALKGSITTIKELDSAMVELQKVTEETGATYDKFIDKAFELGNALGRTGTEVISATADFARMGFSLKDATSLAQEALLMLNVGDEIENLDAATSSIIATLKGFKIEGEQTAEATRRINDVYNEIANNFAITTGSLAEGVRRTSAVMNQAGNSFDQTVAMLTGANEVMQDISKSSSGLNIITQRLKAMDMEGNNIDGLAPKLQSAFEGIGLSLYDTNGELKSTFENLQALSKIYPTLTKEQQNYIGELVSGKRQAVVLQAIMSNWESVEAATVSASEATGSAMKENEKYLNSIEGKTAKLASSGKMFWKNFLDPETIKIVVDGMNGLVKVLDVLINNRLTKFAIQSGVLTGVMVLLGKGIGLARTYLYGLSRGMMGSAMQMYIWSLATKEATLSVAGLTTAMSLSPLFMVATGAMAIMGIVKLVDWLNISLKEQKVIVEDLTISLEGLKSEYTQLLGKEGRTDQENKYLKVLKAEIKANETILKQEAKKLIQKQYLDESNNASQYGGNPTNTSGLTKANQEIAKMAKLQEQLANATKKVDIDRLNGEIAELNTTLISSYKELKANADVLGDELSPEIQSLIDGMEKVIIEADDLTTSAEDADKALLDLSATINTLGNGLQDLEEIQKKVNDGYSFSYKEITDLKEQYPELEKAIYRTTTGWSFEKDTLNAVREAMVEHTRQQIMSEKYNTEQTIIQIRTRLNARMAEAKALSSMVRNPLLDIVNPKGNAPRNPLASLTALGTTKLSNETINANNELAQAESSLRDIEKALRDLDSLSSGGLGGGSPSKKSGGGSTKEIYQAIADAYEKINLELEKNSNLLSRNKTMQDLAGDDAEKKLALMKEEIVLNEQRQKSLNQLNIARRAELLQLEKSLSKNFKFEGEGDNRVISNLDNIKGKSKEVEEQFKRYIDLQSQLLPQASQEWWNLESTISKTSDAMAKLLEQQKELARTDWIKEQNDLYDQQQKRLSALDSIQEAIVAIIRKRGEEEKAQLEDNHNAEMKSLEERYNARKEKYSKELNDFKDLIQGKIDALDDQYEEEDYLEQLAKERDEATRIQGEIDVLALDDSLTARNKTIALRQELADQNEKIAKMQQKKERDVLKESLEDQLELKEDEVKEKEKIADDLFNNDKSRLEEDYKVNKEYLEKKYSDEKVYSEARKAIMDGEVETSKGHFEDIYDAYKDFEDKFGKGMGILGDYIKEDFLSQLDLAKQALNEFNDLSGRKKQYDSDYQLTPDQEHEAGVSGSGRISDMSETDFYQYMGLKKLYSEITNADARKGFSTNAQALRDKYDISSDKYSYEDLIGKSYEEIKKGGFANGGKITETGTLISPFHGTKSDPEWIFNDSQLQKMLKTVSLSAISMSAPKISGINKGQGMVLEIGKLINIEGNATKDIIPLIKKEGNNIISELQKLGNFRPIKT